MELIAGAGAALAVVLGALVVVLGVPLGLALGALMVVGVATTLGVLFGGAPAVLVGATLAVVVGNTPAVVLGGGVLSMVPLLGAAEAVLLGVGGELVSGGATSPVMVRATKPVSGPAPSVDWPTSDWSARAIGGCDATTTTRSSATNIRPAVHANHGRRRLRADLVSADGRTEFAIDSST